MKIILLVVLISASFGFTQGQPALKKLKPELGYTPDLSPKAQRELQRRDSLANKERLTEKEQKDFDRLLQMHDETKQSVWDVIGGECSWYCGGGSYKVLVSSALSNKFSATSANDLSLETAWVEGVKGNGTGQYVEYYFKNKSPRLNMIQVYNGYLKTDLLWKQNGRVKSLKMIINGKPYAILELQDTRALQSFSVPLLGRTTDKKDLVLRFEILEVYPGEKFEDTAITEIFFDGIDVH